MTNSNAAPLRLSIIIPVLNEEGNIGPLIRKVQSSCRAYSFEIIVVDDGSTDGTSKELQALTPEIPELRVLTLKKNFGQTAAMAAGIDHSRGQIIVPLDGDGQNDPEDIPALLAKLDEGYDVVSGWRRHRQDDKLLRLLPSRAANYLIGLTTGVRLHDFGCTLKAYRRSVIGGMQLHGEMHRFLPAWCAWQGGRVAELPVRHHPRVRGESKYGLARIFKVLIDLTTVKFFSVYLAKPNYLFSGAGFIFLFLGFVSGAAAFIDKFGRDRFPQYRIPLLLLAIFFGLVAVFLVFMGVLAELLVRLYFQVRNQKPYRLTDE